MNDLIGQAVAGYPIEKLIGKGSYGNAFQAATSGAPLVVKIVRDDLRGNAGLNASIAKGWEEARAVNHPNLVTGFGAGVDAELGAYCMEELVQAKSLRQIVQGGSKIALRDCLIMAEQLFSAIQALHAAELCHGDIWPSNILVTQDQDVKVEGAGGLAKIEIHPLDVVKGPGIGYLAPEIIAGSPAHPGSDLYAAGACMYFALAGQDPFPGEKVDALSNAILNRKPLALDVLREDLSPEASEFVSRLMSKDPARRYADATSAIADLNRLKNGQPLAPLAAGKPAPAIRFKAKILASTSASPAVTSAAKLTPASRNTPAGPAPTVSPSASSSGKRLAGVPTHSMSVATSGTRVFGRLETHVKSTIPQSDTEKRGDDLYRQGQLPLALQAWKEAYEEGTPHAGLKVKIELAEREIKRELYATGLEDARDRMRGGDFKGAINRVQEAILSAENEQQRNEAHSLEEEIIEESKKAATKDTTKYIIGGVIFLVVALLLIIYFRGGKQNTDEEGPAQTGLPKPLPQPRGAPSKEEDRKFNISAAEATIIRPSQWYREASGGLHALAAGKAVATMKVTKVSEKSTFDDQLKLLREKNARGDKVDDWENFKMVDGRYRCGELGFKFPGADNHIEFKYYYVIAGPGDALYVGEFNSSEPTFTGDLRAQMREIIKSWTYQK